MQDRSEKRSYQVFTVRQDYYDNFIALDTLLDQCPGIAQRALEQIFIGQ